MMKNRLLPHASRLQLEEKAAFEQKLNSGTFTEQDDLDYLAFLNSYNWFPELIKKNGKVGIKSLLGRVIIPAIYDNTRCFLSMVEQQETVAVKKEGKWGLVLTDGIGTPVSEFIFDEILPVSGPAVAVRRGNKWGYLKSNGEKLSETDLDLVYFIIDELTFVNGISIFFKNGLYGVTDGYRISNLVFDEIDNPELGELITGTRNGKRGYISEQGDFCEIEENAWWAICDS